MISLRHSFLSVRSLLIAATTWYSGFFLLSFVTRFACDIGQLAKIWIWVSSEVITICISGYMIRMIIRTDYIITCYTMLRDPTRSKQLSTVAILGFQSRRLYHVIVPLSFSHSISLASVFSCLSIFGWSDLSQILVFVYALHHCVYWTE